MMRFVLLMLVVGLLGCGDDGAERGLALPDEEATPTSDRAMSETEAEREAENLREE